MIHLLLLALVFSPPVFGPLRAGELLLPFFLPYLLRNPPKYSRVEKVYAILLAVAAVTTLISFVTGLNTRGLSAVLTLGRLLELAFLYRIGLHAPASIRITAGVAIGGLSLYGIIDFIHGQLLSGSIFHRAYNSGIFHGESNHVAGSIVILTTLLPVTGVVSAVAVSLSGSRISLAALLLSNFRSLVEERRMKNLILLLLLVVTLGIFSSHFTHERWLNPLSDSTYSGPHVSRIESWRVVIDETPVLTGAGLGARPSAVYESCYFMLFAETGAFGLAAFVCLLGVIALEAPALGIALAILSFSQNTLIIAKIGGVAALLFGRSIKKT